MQPRYFPRSPVLMLAALAFSGFAHAGTAEDAQAAFAKFFPAFVTGNQAQVAAMFAPDAQFYGTLSPELVTTPEGVLKYFTVALDAPPSTVTEARMLSLTTTALTDSVALVAGAWTASRTVDGKPMQGRPLRMTAVLQKRNGQWVVVQFHNSPRP